MQKCMYNVWYQTQQVCFCGRSLSRTLRCARTWKSSTCKQSTGQFRRLSQNYPLYNSLKPTWNTALSYILQVHSAKSTKQCQCSVKYKCTHTGMQFIACTMVLVNSALLIVIIPQPVHSLVPGFGAETFQCHILICLKTKHTSNNIICMVSNISACAKVDLKKYTPQASCGNSQFNHLCETSGEQAQHDWHKEEHSPCADWP